MGNIIVEMYEESIEINQKTGYGFDRIIKKIEPFISSQAYSFSIPNSSIEDIKQDIYVIVIQGIKNFNPEKKTKLSTFLHTHIINKMISKMKSSYKKSKNASYIDGDTFCQEIPKDEFLDDEISDPALYFLKDISKNSIDFSLFLDTLKEHVDYETWLLIKLICVEGLSIRESSERLDINFWTASKKLKDLSKNEYVIEFYERKN